MSKRLLLERIEEQAVTIHQLQQEQKAEREAARRGLETERQRLHDLREEVQRLSTPKDRGKDLGSRYDELHRVILDAHSLIGRDDLIDLDKVKSIHGLIDQVLSQAWFAGNPHDAPPITKPRRATRKPATVPKEADDALWAASDADALALPADERDRDYFARKEVEAEPETDEDAREFARDY